MRSISRVLVVLVSFACSLACGGNIGGFVTGWYLSAAEVAAFADLVVHVRILKSEPVEWQGMVWTETECEVLEAWRGEGPGENLLIRQAGGKVGEMMTEAGPRSDFQPGQEWILAVDPIPGSDGYYTVIGFIQGAFQLRDGKAYRDYTGMRFERPPPDGILETDLSESFAVEHLRKVLVAGGDVGTGATADNGTSPAVGEQSEPKRISIAGPDSEREDDWNGIVAEVRQAEGPDSMKGEEGKTCGYTCIFRRHPLIVFGVLGAAVAGTVVIGLVKRRN